MSSETCIDELERYKNEIVLLEEAFQASMEFVHRQNEIIKMLRDVVRPIRDCDVSYFDRTHWINAYDAVKESQRVIRENYVK